MTQTPGNWNNQKQSQWLKYKKQVLKNASCTAYTKMTVWANDHNDQAVMIGAESKYKQFH